MPFDPAQPAPGSALASQVMRDQFDALEALIDAINAIVAAQVDGVTTLNPGDPASASGTVTGDKLHFPFGIPAGAPGEVTNAALDAAIAGTSNNTNAVATLDTPFADPDTEAMRQKMNELILAARR